MTRVSPRTRNDPRYDATRAALIEKAESLFAFEGIDRVSLRQIGSAIGSANTNVVAYYFGSKESLVKAIFLHRLPALEARRAELLAVAENAGRGRHLATLMHAHWRPIFEQTNGEGRRSYAGFLSAFSRSDWIALRADGRSSFPVTEEILGRIKAAAPQKAVRFLDMRRRVASVILLSVIENIDLLGGSRAGEQGEELFADGLRMAVAAMKAEVD